MECYTAIQKKKRNVAICNNMDRTRGYSASEISQSDKDNYHRISLIWVISEVMYSYQPWRLLCCQVHGVKEFAYVLEHTMYKYTINNWKGWEQTSKEAEFLYVIEVSINSNYTVLTLGC